MISKVTLALLASAALTNGVLAANHHHEQRHRHQKKELVWEATETVTDITWTTVTVAPGESSAAAVTPSSSTSTTSTTPTTSSTLVASTPVASSPAASTPVASTPVSSASPTTMITSTTSSSAAVNVAAVQTSSSSTSAAVDILAVASSAVSSVVGEVTSAVASATSAISTGSSGSSGSSSGSSSGNKRGAAYNTASLISPLIGDGTKVSWAYNWGSSSDGLSDISSALEYVPMLWGDSSEYTSYWETNLQTAIDGGSKYAVSFNEPDNDGQSNLSPDAAAQSHIKYMNPYSGKITIGAPAITNSNIAGESTDWLSDWIEACDSYGGCDYSFCPVHWYNTIDAGADDLLSFVKKAQETCGSDKKIWITEFQPTSGSDDEISSFLETVQDAFDNQSEYDFVERYSYFMVADGNLVSGSSATTFGNTFAYA